MNFQERLNALFKATGMKKNDLPEKLGVSRTMLFSYLAGKNDPPATFLKSVKAAFPWANIEWLLTGEGEMEILIVSESEAEYQTKGQPITPRVAALLANFEALSEEDKKALERTAFALAQSGKLKKEAG